MTSSPKDTVDVDVPDVSDAVHLRSVIEDRELDVSEFAKTVEIEQERLEQILDGDVKLAYSEALRIEKEYEIPIGFWDDLLDDISFAASQG